MSATLLMIIAAGVVLLIGAGYFLYRRSNDRGDSTEEIYPLF